jgi:iron complex transport system ATP-binding protein
MGLEVSKLNLKVENLFVTLSSKIVKDISLHVDDGKFVGIIGPNGCGKSTLLKSIYKVIMKRDLYFSEKGIY